MNKFENKWIMFHEIHKLSREGMKRSQIASFLVMDKRTVKKYFGGNKSLVSAVLSKKRELSK